MQQNFKGKFLKGKISSINFIGEKLKGEKIIE